MKPAIGDRVAIDIPERGTTPCGVVARYRDAYS